jgi:hypothetical protein
MQCRQPEFCSEMEEPFVTSLTPVSPAIVDSTQTNHVTSMSYVDKDAHKWSTCIHAQLRHNHNYVQPLSYAEQRAAINQDYERSMQRMLLILDSLSKAEASVVPVTMPYAVTNVDVQEYVDCSAMMSNCCAVLPPCNKSSSNNVTTNNALDSCVSAMHNKYQLDDVIADISEMSVIDTCVMQTSNAMVSLCTVCTPTVESTISGQAFDNGNGTSDGWSDQYHLHGVSVDLKSDNCWNVNSGCPEQSSVFCHLLMTMLPCPLLILPTLPILPLPLSLTNHFALIMR